VLGASDGNTLYKAIDVFIPKGDIVASGSTEDLIVKGGCTLANQSPLIVFYSGVTLTMTWGKVLNLSSMSFNGVSFSGDGSHIAAHTHTNTIGMLDLLLIFRSDGSLVS
jgi:hypothetical protein